MGVTSVTYVVNPDRVICVGGGMLYGQFLEHFHRQIYGGVYDPLSRFSDEQGLRLCMGMCDDCRDGVAGMT